MAEETEGQDTGAGASGAEPTDTDRFLIIGLVVIIVLGVAVLGWHYRPNTADAICATAEAHCSVNPL
jgi:hypothetical protein